MPEGAVEKQGDDTLRSEPPCDELPGEAVGLFVEFGVPHFGASKRQGDGVRRSKGLRFELCREIRGYFCSAH